MAFKTEDELRTHLDIEHNANGSGTAKGKIKANALLGFNGVAEEDSDEGERD